MGVLPSHLQYGNVSPMKFSPEEIEAFMKLLKEKKCLSVRNVPGELIPIGEELAIQGKIQKTSFHNNSIYHLHQYDCAGVATDKKDKTKP